TLLSEPPPPPLSPPPDCLKTAFDSFRANRSQYATVLLRRMRGSQLRDMLGAPESIDLDKFNCEVWRVVTLMLLNSKSVTPWPEGKKDQLLEDDQLPDFEQALQAGAVKYQGNSIWRNGTSVYGPMLSLSEKDKTEKVRRALRILNDARRRGFERRTQSTTYLASVRPQQLAS